MPNLNDAAHWRCPEDEKAIYQRDAREAADDPELLARWRTTPSLQSACENVHRSQAETFWEIACWLGREQVSDLAARWQEFDRALGPPEHAIVDLGHVALTPTFCRYLARAVEIHHMTAVLSGRHVVELGAGWGALCAILHQLVPGIRYTIVDLPDLQAAQRAALERMSLGGVEFADELPAGDLLVSDYAWSELDKTTQRHYGEAFRQFRRGFMMCPAHQGDHRRHTPVEMVRCLTELAGTRVQWGGDDPHYRELAWRFGDHPRMLDHYRWSAPCR